MFEFVNKLILSALVVALASTTTACSANLGGIPGISGGTIAPISTPANNGGTGGGTAQPSTPASTPAIPFSGGAAPGVENIDVRDNTVVANYINGNMIVNANGVERAIPLPPGQAAAIQAACPPGKQVIVKDNAGNITIDSDGQIFSYNLVEITGNQGEVSIS